MASPRPTTGIQDKLEQVNKQHKPEGTSHAGRPPASPRTVRNMREWLWLMDQSANLTLLLDQWVRGESSALDRLTAVVYPELHSIARGLARRGNIPGEMQTTALVNELFLKLLSRTPRKIESRAHFFALCARLIRQAMVDHYRENAAAKRGGILKRVPLHDDLVWVDANSPQLIALDQALAELEEMDRQQAGLFSMRFLLGCTAEEAAELTGLSKATVDRKVRLAKVWLFQRLNNPAEPISARPTNT